MKYLRWFWYNSCGIRREMCVRMVAGVAQAALGLSVVWLSKRLIDETIRTGSTDDILRQALLLMALTLAGVSLRQLYVYLSNTAYIRKVAELRLRIFSGMFSRWLFVGKEMHSGDVVTRLAKDIEAVSDSMAGTLPQIAVMAVQMAGAFLMMRWFDARLAWALVLLTPMALLAGKAMALRLRRMTLAIREDESRIMMRIQEGMEQNALLRSMQSERWITEQLGLLQNSQNHNYIRRSRFTIVSRFALGCTFSLGYLLAFVWGAYGLRNGTITFGVMTSFLQLVAMIQNPMLSLINSLPALVHSTASIDRLEEMYSYDVSESNSSSPGYSNADASTWGVRMENVTFSYSNGDRKVVDNLTFDFKPGSKTAIVGETGIGKTTLFRLMLGLVDADKGRVTIYREHESQEAGKQTRQHIVFVPQGNTMMSGSIRYNLLLANPTATDSELSYVLQTACADFVFNLPNGIDTVLGERGGGLSEGQAQRLAIARGLLRPGSILLLDEISASLDETTERELMRNIFERYSEKTVICITHRPAVVDMFSNKLRL